MAYQAVEQTPGTGWWWAAVAKTGGQAQAVAIDVDGEPASADNPVPCVVVAFT